MNTDSVIEAMKTLNLKIRPEPTFVAPGPSRMKVMLLTDWNGKDDLTGWLMSEKLDGVCAKWDGQKLWTRSGRQLNPPQWWTDRLPNFPLHGELWGGRGRFQSTSGTVRRTAEDKEWQNIRLAVFNTDWNEMAPFEQRIAMAAAVIHALEPNTVAFIVAQRPIESMQQAMKWYQEVTAQGAEGIVMVNPQAPYIDGRSTHAQRHVPLTRREATVTGHQPGQGAHLGRMGALLVTAEINGQQVNFRIGTGFSNKQRENPPAIGAVITVAHRGLTDSGVPRFPAFVGVRDYE